MPACVSLPYFFAYTTAPLLLFASAEPTGVCCTILDPYTTVLPTTATWPPPPTTTNLYMQNAPAVACLPPFVWHQLYEWGKSRRRTDRQTKTNCWRMGWDGMAVEYSFTLLTNQMSEHIWPFCRPLSYIWECFACACDLP